MVKCFYTVLIQIPTCYSLGRLVQDDWEFTQCSVQQSQLKQPAVCQQDSAFSATSGRCSSLQSKDITHLQQKYSQVIFVDTRQLCRNGCDVLPCSQEQLCTALVSSGGWPFALLMTFYIPYNILLVSTSASACSTSATASRPSRMIVPPAHLFHPITNFSPWPIFI